MPTTAGIVTTRQNENSDKLLHIYASARQRRISG